jgi:5-methyltetrahydropteroyltriglutamate--homocysteine methyltransferase
MQRSDDRILTTHTGSLVRPPAIAEVLRAEVFGEAVDEAAFSQQLASSVREVVQRQRAAGIDVPSDGEFGKIGWNNYVIQRFGGISPVESPTPSTGSRRFGQSRDRTQFAEFYERLGVLERTAWMPPGLEEASVQALRRGIAWETTGPITYQGAADMQRDIAHFQAALDAAGIEEGFLPVVAPGSVEATQRNGYYATEEEHVYAIADALRHEYQAIVDAGLLLQVDDAFMPALYDRLGDMSKEEFLAFSELRIDALNHALTGIPEDRVRYHICWGSWNGPHVSDVPLRDIVHLVLKVHAQAYSVEAANPRHEHEWQVWEDVRLPEGKILIPGVVTHSTNVVEHPELVAWRLSNFARLVGREQVIGGTDCGFAQHWNLIRTHESIQWAKLESLAEGARIASTQLWGR